MAKKSAPAKKSASGSKNPKETSGPKAKAADQVDEGSQADDKAAERGGSLGAFIRAQREMANLSLRQVSAMTEISNAYLSQIERDLHEPSIRILKNVGRALGISPDVLLSRAGLSAAQADDDAGEPSVSTEDAIQADPHLSADEKQALLTVYRSYRSAKS